MTVCPRRDTRGWVVKISHYKSRIKITKIKKKNYKNKKKNSANKIKNNNNNTSRATHSRLYKLTTLYYIRFIKTVHNNNNIIVFDNTEIKP